MKPSLKLENEAFCRFLDDGKHVTLKKLKVKLKQWQFLVGK
jgi:hypothetical protein